MESRAIKNAEYYKMDYHTSVALSALICSGNFKPSSPIDFFLSDKELEAQQEMWEKAKVDNIPALDIRSYVG